MCSIYELKAYVDASFGMIEAFNFSIFEFIAYLDVSFGMNEDLKSTTGFLIYLNDKLISWKTTKQKTTALSAAETEINAATEWVKEALWIKGLLGDMNIKMIT